MSFLPCPLISKGRVIHGMVGLRPCAQIAHLFPSCCAQASKPKTSRPRKPRVKDTSTAGASGPPEQQGVGEDDLDLDTYMLQASASATVQVLAQLCNRASKLLYLYTLTP